ncbi:MAG TPA: hypothetical protein VK772_12300 [Puia sp.]|nr:hypothetical protein [Puia sp.]
MNHTPWTKNDQPVMDLQKELMKQQTLVQCNRIIKYISDNETRFADLPELNHTVTASEPYSQMN